MPCFLPLLSLHLNSIFTEMHFKNGGKKRKKATVHDVIFGRGVGLGGFCVNLASAPGKMHRWSFSYVHWHPVTEMEALEQQKKAKEEAAATSATAPNTSAQPFTPDYAAGLMAPATPVSAVKHAVMYPSCALFLLLFPSPVLRVWLCESCETCSHVSFLRPFPSPISQSCTESVTVWNMQSCTLSVPFSFFCFPILYCECDCVRAVKHPVMYPSCTLFLLLFPSRVLRVWLCECCETCSHVPFLLPFPSSVSQSCTVSVTVWVVWNVQSPFLHPFLPSVSQLWHCECDGVSALKHAVIYPSCTLFLLLFHSRCTVSTALWVLWNMQSCTLPAYFSFFHFPVVYCECGDVSAVKHAVIYPSCTLFLLLFHSRCTVSVTVWVLWNMQSCTLPAPFSFFHFPVMYGVCECCETCSHIPFLHPFPSSFSQSCTVSVTVWVLWNTQSYILPAPFSLFYFPVMYCECDCECYETCSHVHFLHSFPSSFSQSCTLTV